MALMSRIMEGLRGAPPKQVYNRRVTEVADYEASVKRILTEGGKEAEREEIRLPKSDVLELALEDGSSLIVRPSGTEPKLKVYFSAKGESREESRRVINGLKGEVKGWIGRWTE